MRRLAIFLIVFVASIWGIAAPAEQKVQRILEAVQAVKNPENWNRFDSFGNLIEYIHENAFAGRKDKDFTKIKEAFADLNGAFGAVHAYLKAILTEGGKATDEELTIWAKTFSRVLRESHFNLRKYDLGNKNQLITNETVDILKAIVVENPMAESGNLFLEKLKERLPKLYVVGKKFKAMHDHIIEQMNRGEKVLEKMPEMTAEEREMTYELIVEFLIDERFALLRTERNAIIFFKIWAIFFDTLRDPASYDSLQAMFDGFARVRRHEAHAILVREAGECIGTYASDENKAKFYEHIKSFLDVLKALFADGQNTDVQKLNGFINKVKTIAVPSLRPLQEEIESNYAKEGSLPFRRCLVQDEDRRSYREVLAMDEPFLTDEKLDQIRKKNEKVYALVYLINSLVRGERRREGLGTEAQAYFKQLFTTKHALLRLAEYMKPSEETTAMIKAAVKEMVAKHNALSADAKKELVNMFPYRTVIGQSLLT